DIKSTIESEFHKGEPAFNFLAASLALMTEDAKFFRSTIGTDPAAGWLRATIAALAWAERDAAGRAIGHLHKGVPLGRAIALGALGARRSDQGAILTTALADSSPLVRARAYRTTGQLGRADLMVQLRPGLTDPDPECRFWSAWAAARMGATEPLDILADIAWNNLHRADRALDLLLRRFNVPQANAWLREFAKLPDRQRALIRATGVIGDPLYIPWLIEHMATPATARLAGESLSMITGLDLAYRDLDRRPPADFQSGPNDDPADENVSLDEDENLPWPDPERIGQWWTANRSRFSAGTAYFLGTPKVSADWLEALSDAFQRQRHAAALELAIRQPDKAMFEVRARGRLQRQLIARARGLA
ncbi:MAG: TIGR02270 family protein, partial [Acetobacteraceae bacterium]